MKRDVSVIMLGIFGLAAPCGIGCGPQAPKEILEAPPDYPAALAERRLFHTPHAYIYARSDEDAGEADRWVREIGKYIRDNFDAELEKGIVLIMAPEDQPIVTTLEEQMAIERDPAIMITPPRHPKSIAEVRQRLRDEGIPERAMVRATTLPLTANELRGLGLDGAAAAWAVAAPSGALARECGVEVGIGALRKKRPDVPEDRARSLVSSMSGQFARPFEIVRSVPVFVLWVQRQQNWTDDQRREAIREHIKHLYRSNWMPAPSDEDLEW